MAALAAPRTALDRVRPWIRLHGAARLGRGRLCAGASVRLRLARGQDMSCQRLFAHGRGTFKPPNNVIPVKADIHVLEQPLQDEGADEIAAKAPHRPEQAGTIGGDGGTADTRRDHSLLSSVERFEWLTAKDARNRFLLRQSDLEGLPCQRRTNPYGRDYARVRLFRAGDLEQAALARWGSATCLEREKETRRLRRQARRAQSLQRQQQQRREAAAGAGSTRRQGSGKDLSGSGGSELGFVPGSGEGDSVPTLAKHAWTVASTRVHQFMTLPASEVDGLRTVRLAIATNAVVCVVKFGATALSGSSSMLSEALHSLADTVNQALMGLGLVSAVERPDDSHPYGYAADRYVWALISGVGVFFLGCGLSISHGVNQLLHPTPVEGIPIALAVLAAAGLLEGYTLWTASQEIAAGAAKAGMPFWRYVRETDDATTAAVMLEDCVSVAGVTVAGVSLGLAHTTGITSFDAVGSIVVGGLLGGLACFLIAKNRHMLLSKSLPPARLAKARRVLASDPVIASVHAVRAVMVGYNSGRLRAEVNLNPVAVMQAAVARQAAPNHAQVIADAAAVAVAAAEQAASACVTPGVDSSAPTGKPPTQGMGGASLAASAVPVDSVAGLPEVDAVMNRYGLDLFAAVGHELDRLETLLKEELPEVQWVDLVVF